ncbi:diguanylate cyclase [Novosphingobium mangrovi (ex Huang et al. 2023)]|uniref:diguanylate cyclase n=1 Tax=Novosphingobium mangrovi (ex Huang et al. 2023) TaxID=2976432 RepID=A0ABT2I984_9SPHN|nr:diguanylate cyclase [Novosphingobium mangrovi (ex Huang et al. 2023)]MCT2401128.1 diguanylate cyclase [Novosphingobium mangrovi (ex Huang et al. 2023)]
MTRFRTIHQARSIDAATPASCSVMLVEDSAAMALMLKSRIEAETACEVEWFKTYAEASQALAQDRPGLAVTGMNLPDAPDGEIIDLLEEEGVPTILFTATLNRKVRERACAAHIVDYFIKDAQDTVDHIIHTIQRITDATVASILIVDDSESARLALADILSLQNYRIHQAGCGEEALAALRAHDDIQLVVTDFHMPDMDGQELTRRIRAAYPPEQVRIIGISASSDPFLSAALIKAGASDFVYRPYIAEEVKCRISSNIETLSHMRRLRFLAERDFLTGMYNRRAFFEKAQSQLARLRKQGGSASLAILDIDHFKKVNDGYGHDVGDQVIQMVAKAVQAVLARHKCLSARLGGEEFVLLLADMTSDEAVAVCEEVRRTIEEAVVPHNAVKLRVTASIGIALIQPDEALDNNLNAADQMLYMAKEQGRNRICTDAVFYRTAS